MAPKKAGGDKGKGAAKGGAKGGDASKGKGRGKKGADTEVCRLEKL